MMNDRVGNGILYTWQHLHTFSLLKILSFKFKKLVEYKHNERSLLFGMARNPTRTTPL